MSHKLNEIEKFVAHILATAKKIIDCPAPNEEILEASFSELQAVSSTIPEIIDKLDRISYISEMNKFMSQIKIPDVEHMTASRGLLVTHTLALELLSSIQFANSEARKRGYADPDVANLDLKTPSLADFLEDIDKRLVDIQSNLAKIDNKIERSHASGVSVGIGAVSVDIKVLYDILKNATADTREYISARATVSAQTLRDKLSIISQSSISFMQAISEKTREFGRKVVQITTKIAKAANEAYATGLKLIKKSFGRHKETLDTLPQNVIVADMHASNYIPIPEDTIRHLLGHGGQDYTKAAEFIMDNIIDCTYKIKLNRIIDKGVIIMQFGLFKSHTTSYASVSIGRIIKESYVPKGMHDTQIVHTYKLNSSEYDVLKRIDQIELNTMANHYLNRYFKNN